MYKNTGLIGTALLLAGAALFFAWLAKAEVSGHRVIAPPALVILAACPAFLGFIIGADWLLTTGLRKSVNPQETQPRALHLAQILLMLPLLLITPLILLAATKDMLSYSRSQRSWSQIQASMPEIQARRDADKLIEQLSHSDSNVRVEAAAAIAQLDFHLSRSAEPALRALLDDEDHVAIAAARTLESIPLASRSAVPELERMLLRGSMQLGQAHQGALDPVRQCAAEVLGRKATHLGSQGTLVLLDALRHDNPDVRHAAAHGLGLMERYPSNVATAREHLQRALGDQDPRVRAAAQAALNSLNPS